MRQPLQEHESVVPFKELFELLPIVILAVLWVKLAPPVLYAFGWAQGLVSVATFWVPIFTVTLFAVMAMKRVIIPVPPTKRAVFKRQLKKRSTWWWVRETAVTLALIAIAWYVLPAILTQAGVQPAKTQDAGLLTSWAVLLLLYLVASEGPPRTEHNKSA